MQLHFSIHEYTVGSWLNLCISLTAEIAGEVKASSICGSNILEWYRTPKAPLVLGHEIAGDVAQLGGAVEKYQVGNGVFVTHHVPCNTCHYCLNGYYTACKTLCTPLWNFGKRKG